jgi:hypothetical protein
MLILKLLKSKRRSYKKVVQGKPIFETTVNDYWQKRFVKT